MLINRHPLEFRIIVRRTVLRFFSFLVLFGLTGLHVRAQNGAISGRLIDSKKNPVPYANIVICQPDTSYVGATVSDSAGFFMHRELLLEK